MISGSCSGWPLRGPRETLAGCVWLARLTDKIRLHHAGKLPADFAPFLGHPRGVDGHFLRHFGLTLDSTVEAIIAARDDSEVERWFLSHPNAFQIEIESWNTIAPNLGRSAFPMTTELQYVISRVLEPEARITAPATIFDAIEVDNLATLRKHSKP